MRFLLTCIIILLTTVSALGRIINVPTDYATIQAGIDASVTSDTVLVAAGTYTENPLIEDKNIVLQSTGLPDNTVIQGYTIISGEEVDTSCVLQGFEIYRGSVFNHDLLEITNASPKIQGNIITGNSSAYQTQFYTGVTISYSNAIIRSNIIKFNSNYYLGHGIKATNSFPLIEGNIIWGNGAHGAGWDAFGWGVTIGSGILRYNLVANNGASSGESSAEGGFMLEVVLAR